VNNLLEMLKSLKNDLLGRRLLPFVALAGVALAGGVAYAVLAGGSSSSSTTVAAIPALPPAPKTVATPAPANPNVAVSEMTGGAHLQRGGPTRDPFVPLPQPKSKTVAPSSPTTSTTPSKSSSGGSSGSTGSGSGGGTPSTGPSPSPSPTPAKPKKQAIYHVALLFGLAPPPGQNPQLTPYTDLIHPTALPSKQHALIELVAVVGGKGAIFKLLQPPILKGPAICLPSASQCEAIALAIGPTEELSYVSDTGQTVVYQLQVVSITKGEATTARTAGAANRLDAHVFAVDHSGGVPRPRAHVHPRGPSGWPATAR
jgi:hypothetical protein